MNFRTFWWLVHQINFYTRFLNWNRILEKIKQLLAKVRFFATVAFCAPHSICLNIGFWESSFVWKCWVFNLITKKRYSSFLKTVCVFQKIFFQGKVSKTFKISTDCHIKTCRSIKRRANLKIPSTVFFFFFVEEPVLFLLALKSNL